MDEVNRDNLILLLKQSIKDLYEYKCEKSINGALYIAVYSFDGFLDMVNILGAIGAYFNVDKRESFDGVHEYEYGFTINDCKEDLSKYVYKPNKKR